MSAIIILSFFLLAIPNNDEHCFIDIEITNIRNNKGKIWLELFDENHQSIYSQECKIIDKQSRIQITVIKPSQYAIRYFHDENGNNKLDSNIFGIPKEGYGFSNNAHGMFGPHAFQKWLFKVEGETKVSMKTSYIK